MNDISVETLEEFYAYVREVKGILPRFNRLTGGITKAEDGEFVLYKDHQKQIKLLKKRIADLETEASKQYSKGYGEGRNDGPEYNMRNN